MLLHKIIALICCILLILCILLLWKNKFAGNKVLLKITSFHQIYAFLLLVLALIHGILAGNNPAMFSGKIAWMILLLIILFAYIIKQNKPKLEKNPYGIIYYFCRISNFTYYSCNYSIKKEDYFKKVL